MISSWLWWMAARFSKQPCCWQTPCEPLLGVSTQVDCPHRGEGPPEARGWCLPPPHALKSEGHITGSPHNLACLEISGPFPKPPPRNPPSVGAVAVLEEEEGRQVREQQVYHSFILPQDGNDGRCSTEFPPGGQGSGLVRRT